MRFLREALTLYFSCRAPQAAACLAYFLLLTVFPMLICVSFVLGLVNIDIVSLMESLGSVLPDEALEVISSYLRYISYRQSPGLFIAGLAAGWFSAAAAFRTITRVILDVYTDVSQSMVRGMVVSVAFPLALLLTIDLSIIVVVTGQRTLESLGQHLPFLDQTLQPWVAALPPAVFHLLLIRPGGVRHGRPQGDAPGAHDGQQPGLCPGPGDGLRPVFLVHRPVLPLLPGLRLPGVHHYPPGVAVLLRPNPLFGDCVHQRVVPPAARRKTGPLAALAVRNGLIEGAGCGTIKAFPGIMFRRREGGWP